MMEVFQMPSHGQQSDVAERVIRKRPGRMMHAAVAAVLAGLFALPTLAEPGRLQVVCTTTMIADLARVIAGDVVDLHGIMRPGEDPHVYEVRPRDVQLIAKADVLLMNGLHLESTLGHAIANNASDALVVKLAETPLIVPLESEQFRGAPDPHCWFNVRYFRAYAERARDALIKADPKNADGYRRRASEYVEKLDALHTWVQTQISSIPRARRAMVTSHDAFQYFGRTYFIDVYAVIGISTEQQPRPRDIARLESVVRERNVKALFVETSVSQTLNNLVRKIADRTGVRIGGTLYSDSLGAPDTPAGTYIGMVRHNVNTIVKALK